MGKVHGSLARAGKVKSQTPKVCRDTKRHPAQKCSNLSLSLSFKKKIKLKFFFFFFGGLLLMYYMYLGWAAREEENPQRPGEEADYVYSTICECYPDRRQTQGSFFSLSDSSSLNFFFFSLFFKKKELWIRYGICSRMDGMDGYGCDAML